MKPFRQRKKVRMESISPTGTIGCQSVLSGMSRLRRKSHQAARLSGLRRKPPPGAGNLYAVDISSFIELQHSVSNNPQLTFLSPAASGMVLRWLKASIISLFPWDLLLPFFLFDLLTTLVSKPVSKTSIKRGFTC